MKTTIYRRRCFILLYFGLALASKMQAQICTNPTDTLYSMTTAGILYPLNVVSALNGTGVTTSATAVSSNGLGYSLLDGKFYFFNKTGTGAAPSPQFASYDIATSILSVLPTPPASILNTQKVRSGCVNHLGSGYYTINPSSSGGATPALYYYNIATTSWTTITTSFLSPSSVSLNATFNSLNSGDMAFDGGGNLWILCSNTSNYALFKIAAPVPTTAVASITAQQIIASTPVPGTAAFTGIAFNSVGTLYLTTGNPDNKLYKLPSIAAGMTLVGSITTDIGADLTSCSYPLSVLASAPMTKFRAVLKDGVNLDWDAAEDDQTLGYKVEFSMDATHWTTLAFINAQLSLTGSTVSYSYTHRQYIAGNNFYRIVQTSINGQEAFSAVKLINTKGNRSIIVGPNPAKDLIYIYNKGNSTKYLAQIFDRAGRLVYSAGINPSEGFVNIAGLQKGSYILKLSSPADNAFSSYQFIKW